MALANKATALRSTSHDLTVRMKDAAARGDRQRVKLLLEEQKTAAAQLAKLQAEVPAAPADAAVTTSKETIEDANKAVVSDTADGTTAQDTADETVGCAGDATQCLFGGLYLASYSLTFAWGHRDGQTGHHIVQIAVPTVGYRHTLNAYLSLDASLYTALISPQLQLNPSSGGSSCAPKSGGVFEAELPCEGNSELRPYLAGLFGVTVGTGRSEFGLLSIGVTAGAARTSQDPTALAFIGLMITTGGVYTTIPLSKTKDGAK